MDFVVATLVGDVMVRLVTDFDATERELSVKGAEGVGSDGLVGALDPSCIGLATEWGGSLCGQCDGHCTHDNDCW